MGKNWFDYVITQDHGANGEQGVDFGTPIDTPVTSLYGGIVKSVGYGPWGGLVTGLVDTPQGPLTEYALHLDSIAVKPGDPLTPGTLLGYSGGQLSGGQHPVDPQYSSGPHLEYGFFSGSAFASASVDPEPLIAMAKGNQDVSLLGYAFPPGWKLPPGGITATPPGSPGAAINAGVAGAFNAVTGTPAAIAGIPGQIGHGIADAFAVGTHDVGVFLQRQVIAFFVAALVLLVLFKL